MTDRTAALFWPWVGAPNIRMVSSLCLGFVVLSVGGVQQRVPRAVVRLQVGQDLGSLTLHYFIFSGLHFIEVISYRRVASKKMNRECITLTIR